MANLCTYCHKPINDEYVTGDSLGEIPGDLFHPECYPEYLQEVKEDNERRALTAAMKESAKEEDELTLKTQLLKGRWFLKGAEVLIERNPIYYDETETWWVWNYETSQWEAKDETDILNHARRALDLVGDTSIRHSSSLLKAFQQESRLKKPKEPPIDWIQFGNEFFDITTGQRTKSTPEYFSTNAIPWSVGKTTNTPVMDSLITSWVGDEYLQTVYELIAYCTYRDYPIHRIFCFVGSGANGKTRLIKIIEKFIGKENQSSLELQKLSDNSFAVYQLYRKLACFIGETSHHKLDCTDKLKRLSGQDPVDFEAKGKNSFSGMNYAKLIIGTNVLPPANDTSRGWYRRWFVINFPNEFQEGEDVLKRIPDTEYENLVAKCISILPDLLKRGGFSKEGTIEERKEKYMEKSNPIKQYLYDNYTKETNGEVKYSECYINYLSYLSERKLRRVSKREFSALLEDEGLEIERKTIKGDVPGEYQSVFLVFGISKRDHNTVNTNNTEVPIAPISLYSDFRSKLEVGIFEHNGINFSWTDWIDNQPGGTVPVELFLAYLVTNHPGVDYEQLKINGEVYEPRDGYVRRVL